MTPLDKIEFSDSEESLERLLRRAYIDTDQERVEEDANDLFERLEKAVCNRRPEDFYAYHMLEDNKHHAALNSRFLEICVNRYDFIRSSGYDLVINQQKRTDEDTLPFAVEYFLVAQNATAIPSAEA